MDYPICPSCKGENTYHDSIQFVCPDCGHEWTGNEAEEHDDDQLIVKDSNGNLLADGDDVLLIKDLKLKGSSEVLKNLKASALLAAITMWIAAKLC
mgnify:FL=1